MYVLSDKVNFKFFVFMFMIFINLIKTKSCMVFNILNLSIKSQNKIIFFIKLSNKNTY